MSDTSTPTERDRFWLAHEAALAKSGQTAKAYAAEHDVSLQALYQARKRLRALGLLAKGRTRCVRTKTSRGSAAFSKVELITPRTPLPDFRLCLPGGVVLEWSGAEFPSPVIELVERLTQPR